MCPTRPKPSGRGGPLKSTGSICGERGGPLGPMEPGAALPKPWPCPTTRPSAPYCGLVMMLQPNIR